MSFPFFDSETFLFTPQTMHEYTPDPFSAEPAPFEQYIQQMQTEYDEQQGAYHRDLALGSLHAYYANNPHAAMVPVGTVAVPPALSPEQYYAIHNPVPVQNEKGEWVHPFLEIFNNEGENDVTKQKRRRVPPPVITEPY